MTKGRYRRRFDKLDPSWGVTFADTQAKIALLTSPDVTRRVAEMVVKAYGEYI
jgi:hypothetical protein